MQGVHFVFASCLESGNFESWSENVLQFKHSGTVFSLDLL